MLKAKCYGQVCKRFVNAGNKSDRISVTFVVEIIDPEDGYMKSLTNFTNFRS